MNVATVAAELAADFSGVTGLRVYPYPPDGLAAPALIVGYPDTIEFDQTMGRGGDLITFPVYLVVDRNWDRASAEQFAAYTAGSGASSVKALIEAGSHTAFGAARVRSCSFSVIAVAGVEYWVATFLVDIYGTGS